MPYKWITKPGETPQQLRLWPHQSLPARGFAAFILVTFTLILIPTFPLLGTTLLWGLLPFVLMAVGGIYFALQGNHRALQINEVLTLDNDTAHLTHTTPQGEVKQWECNRYWVQIFKYERDGPVPHYVTLRGNGREVQIGAFLSEDERISLYDDLMRHMHK